MNKSVARRRVIQAFLKSKYDRAGQFHTIGGVLYSYAIPLAKIENGKAVPLPGLDEDHSATTSAHQYFTRVALTQDTGGRPDIAWRRPPYDGRTAK